MSLDDLTSHTPSPSQPHAAPARSLAWLLPAGLLVGFIGILVLLFGERLLPATPVTTAPVVTIRAAEHDQAGAKSKVSTGKGPLAFQASGWVEPDPYTVFATTLINGVVDSVHILEGQSVSQGQLLATLVDDEAKLDLKEAEQRHSSMEKRIVAHCTGVEIFEASIAASRKKIAALETSLDEASDTFSRLSRLSKGAVSEQQLVRARLATERQRAMIAEAKADIPRLEAQITQIHAERDSMESTLAELLTAKERAQLALDRTRITAPITGSVLHLHAAPGKKRMLDMDDPLSAIIVELYDPAHLQARIDVPLNEAAALSQGQSVELISDLLPEKTFTGTVTRISGQADLQRNTLQAKVAIANPDPRLRPDMLVRAKFFSTNGPTGQDLSASSSSRLAIFVPKDAVTQGNQVWTITQDGKAQKRTLTLGTTQKDGHHHVVEGLRSGESVILPPHSELSDGQRVKTTSNN